MGVGRIFSMGATMVKFYFVNSKLSEKRFSTKHE